MPAFPDSNDSLILLHSRAKSTVQTHISTAKPNSASIFSENPYKPIRDFPAFSWKQREIAMNSAKCQHFAENPAQNADSNADSHDFCRIRTLES